MKRLLRSACAGLALLCSAGLALANWQTYDAGTVTNTSTATSNSMRIAGAVAVTYAATFTASSVGTTTLAIETSWDNATWFVWLSTSGANTSGANIRALPVVANASTVPVIPGLYARVKLTNTTGASITSTTLGLIAN